MNLRTPDESTLPRDVARLLGSLPARPARHVVARSWGAHSVRGTRREANEDAWGQRAARWFAVADGMGGRPGGAAAAEAAVGTMLDALEHGDRRDWHAAVTMVNDAVRGAAWAAGLDRSGAALAAVELHDARATIVHLGDVRIYRMRRGAAEQLTTDHSIAEELRRLGVSRLRLRPAELAALTVYLGDPDSSRGFAVRTITVDDGDRLTICSDGVHRMAPASLWQALAGEDDDAAAELLVRSAQLAGGTDDATALVVTLGVGG